MSDATASFGSRMTSKLRAVAGKRDGALFRGVWTLLDQGVVSGGNFIGMLAMARGLSQEEYGVFAILFGVMLALQLFNATLVYHPLSVRLPVAGPEDQPKLVAHSAGLAGVLSLLLCAPMAIGLLIFDLGEIAPAAVSAFLFWQVQESLRRGFLCSFRLSEAIPGDALRYLGQGAGIIALAYWGELTLERALWMMAGAAALAAVLQAAQIGVFRASLHGLSTTAADFWRIGGLWTLGGGLLAHFRLHLLPIALATFHGPAAAAGFQAAMNVLNLLNPITISVGNIVPQAAAQGHRDGLDAAWRAARTYGALGLAPILGYALIALALPVTILTVFYGADSPYTELALPIQLLMTGLVLSYVSDVFDSYLHGVVELRHAFLINMVGTATVALGAFPLVYAFGLVGGCLAFIAANLARIVAAMLVQRSLMSGHAPARSPVPL